MARKVPSLPECRQGVDLRSTGGRFLLVLGLALDGLIAEVVEDHIREHVIDPKASRDNPRARADEELVEIVHSFLT